MTDDANAAWPYPRPDSPPLLTPEQAEHTLNVWLVPRFSMLTLFCLLEPLRVANRFGRNLFAWRLLSADGEAVVASNGVRIDVDGALESLEDMTRLMVVSSYEAEATVSFQDRAVLRRIAAHGGWLGGLDTAPFILARAGVLEGHRVALHWESVPAFRLEFPELEISPARFEFDATRLTGSGGAASIDMMLEWIEQAYGPALADAVGRQLVHERARGDGGSDQRHRYQELPRSVVRALATMEANLAQALPVPEVCRLAGQSQRQLARLFQRHFGESPQQCYLGMRLDRARQLLADSRCQVTEAALATGFTQPAHFTRAYRSRFGEAPSITADRGSGAILPREGSVA
ncbi:GlxA family transcriptional regulator [Halomonas urumqiensis]|uniref:AraC family transcriptional regulator n=1 Tax=Halomonas urumqiensis TaxID=1684789 RepID=A0A2N7UNK5_9GAMM|nr:GlxA family transcriptional regulator [Halomonas urumqiensis]PMR82033.1 AraC family transcriptional regulator [Halomonas urumqiensis]PTB02635.1 GlxA family transcriptional regulator [Halomonas urumqiensis]GHE21119.1 HTH-type transcriptional regulator CdhR [Halomonas urumqiensis]